MGRKIIGGVLLISFLVFPSLASAVYHGATPGGRLGFPETLQNQAQTANERRIELQETLRAKREEFRERLQMIRDEVKRSLVERIDAKITSVNQRVTARFSTALNRLQTLLDRLVGRAQDEKLAGKDTEVLELAITEAQNAIETARVAAVNQAESIYVIEIASESALRNDVGDVVSNLATDLRDVHKLVIEAKQSVQMVITELAKLGGVGSIREEAAATVSAEQ